MIRITGIVFIAVALVSCASAGSGGPAVSAWTFEARCQAIWDWVSRLKSEYPSIDPTIQSVASDASEVANLYRDKYFVPVFGFRYESANAEKLRRVNLEVIYQCQGSTHHRIEKWAQKLGPHKPFLDMAFVYNARLAAIVAERRTIEKWMDDVAVYTEQAAHTNESLQDLTERYIPAAKRDLNSLWPSEKRAFIDKLEERKRLLAKELTPTMTATLPVDVVKESERAKAWFEEGLRYELGHERAKNVKQAALLYERAANEGYVIAETRLGLLYQAGDGVPKDPMKAFELYTKAAESGGVLAQFNLANCYINGIGTTANLVLARKWIIKAAEAGHQQGQLMAGFMMQQGMGGERNEFAARRWWEKASAGPDRTIAEKSQFLQKKLEERLLFSGAFNDAELAVIAGVVGAVVVGLIANPNPSLADNPGGPPKIPRSPISIVDCIRRTLPELAWACF